MKARFRHDVVHRWEGNPAISAEDIPFPCNTVFNTAAVKVDGQYILLLRVEDLRGHSVLALAKSDDGLHLWNPTARSRSTPAGPIPAYASARSSSKN